MQEFKHLQYQNLNWYHFNQALSLEDQDFLHDTFSFSRSDLEYCRSKKSPRPRLTLTKKYLFLIFHIPFKPSGTSRFKIAELNVFVTPTTLITIESKGNLAALDHFLLQTQKSKKLLQSRFSSGMATLFSKLILKILSALEEDIDQQGEHIDRLHREIFEKRLAKKFVETTSTIRYNQVLSQHAIARQIRFFDQYKGDKNPLIPFNHSSKTNWNQILETFQAINYELESDISHLEGLVKTFESLVTFRTNAIIKILTIFSVILMPLNLIAGIYGMNFHHLPLSQLSLGFFIILTLMISISLLMAGIFRLKRWY